MTCALSTCQETFTPKNESHLYCSTKCGQKAWHERYKAEFGISYHTQYWRDLLRAKREG